MISVIIPVYNNWQLTSECLASVFKKNKKNPDFEVIIVDNASTEKNLKHCYSMYPVTVIKNKKNLGFVKAVNQGIKYALSRHTEGEIVLMNNDVEVYDWWLTDLYNMVNASEKIGIVGAWNNFLCRHFLAGFDLVIIKRSVIEKIGLLSEEYGIGCFDDHDYCLRAELSGFHIYKIPINYVHKEHKTISSFNRDQLVKDNYHVFIEKFRKKFSNPLVFPHLKAVIEHYEQLYPELKSLFTVDYDKKRITLPKRSTK